MNLYTEPKEEEVLGSFLLPMEPEANQREDSGKAPKQKTKKNVKKKYCYDKRDPQLFKQ